MYLLFLFRSNNLHSKVVATVRNLLACHDSDPRYAAPECRMRVAALYIPLLAITMDALPLLYHWQLEHRDKFSSEEYGSSGISQNVALAIAGKMPPPTYDTFQQVTIILLCCVKLFNECI